MAEADHESTRTDFRCPACRARQELQPMCRRCGADLSLLVRIHLRVDHLLAHPCDTHDRELALLAPKRLRFGGNPGNANARPEVH